jgi:AraC family transcriptional regulator
MASIHRQCEDFILGPGRNVVLDGFKVLHWTSMLKKFDGAIIKRTIDRSHACVPEHAHDWPMLSLFVFGAYSSDTETGRSFICGPSAVFYRAGAAHRNEASSDGFEQIEIEFDPAWLQCSRLPDDPVRRWEGGRAGAAARSLARHCVRQDATEASLLEALRNFIDTASSERQRNPPAWVGTVARRLKEDTSLNVSDLAKDVSLHPSWLGSAYRAASGETLPESAARFRIERAARFLRETDEPYAFIASEAGFCDQSHMNRTFRRALGRLPSAVRADRYSIRESRV